MTIDAQVVGIADCSVESDLSSTVTKFAALTNRYRISPSTSVMQQGVVPKTCLAFEMTSDQKDPDQSNFKVIPDQDFAHFNFYITHIFGEEFVRMWLPLWESTVKTDPEVIADKIFDSLYGPSENVSNPSTSHSALITSLDIDLPDEAPKGRKRRLVGRIRKQFGDLCLFAGSPVDAMNQYRQAIEISRSCSDWEWVGSALESMASAVLSVRDANGLDRLSPQEVSEISSRLTEARTCYNRRARGNYLEAENLLRTALFFQQQSRFIEMSDMLSKCRDVVETLDASNFQARIRLFSAIALIFRGANFTRKYAFFIQLICRLCVASNIPPVRSHQLLEQVAPEYDISANSLIQPQTSKSVMKSRREKLISSGASWSKLQASILSLMIDLSSSSGDTMQSIKYLVYMMRQVAPALMNASYAEPSIFSPVKTDWGQRLRQLSANMPPPLDTAEGDPLRLGLGMLRKWKAIKDPSVYMHISRSVNDPLFLYRPNRKAKEAIAASANHVFCWPGHTVYFDVTLRNHLLQKAVLEDVQITFTPIVLTTVEPRPGDIRTEVDWLPQIMVEPTVGTAAQLIVEPGDNITVKLSAIIPSLCDRPLPVESSSTPQSQQDGQQTSTQQQQQQPQTSILRSILEDHRSKILLVPDKLVYNMFNCPFGESMTAKFNMPPKNLLLDCLHYIADVPSVSVSDSLHPWLSYTTSIRDTDSVVVIQSKSPLPEKGTHESELASNSGLALQTGSSSVVAAPAPSTANKSTIHLTIAISQLRGETFSTKLVLKNESVYPVDDFGLSIVENGETLSPNKISQVLVGDMSKIYETISKALPMQPGEEVEIPLQFVSPSLGLVQICFNMEYRNNGSAENMWRKVKMEYSFKVVESATPLKLDVTSGSELSLDVLDRAMPHSVIIIGDSTVGEELNSTGAISNGTEEEKYILLQLSLQNKTMLSFHVVKDDQSTSALVQHNAFVLDPWATKLFCLALHRQSFVERMKVAAHALVSTGAVKGANAFQKAYHQACKEFLVRELKLSWRSYSNRTGIIHFDPNLIEEATLQKLFPHRVTTSLRMETAKGELMTARVLPETPGIPSFVLQTNQIYKICAEVKNINSSIADIELAEAPSATAQALDISSPVATTPTEHAPTLNSYFSTMCRAHHLNTNSRNMSWIGKSQNIALAPLTPSQTTSLQIPLLFHNPGIYTLTARVHEKATENTDDYWSRDISVVVTR